MFSARYRILQLLFHLIGINLQTLNLDQYMLYAHGSDLCHDSELRHAMANCFEALMGALFLDGGIEVTLMSKLLGNGYYHKIR